MKVLAIKRAEQFSPNSIEKDEAILTSVVLRLREKGHEVVVQRETDLSLDLQSFQYILTMGRLPETLCSLKKVVGSKILNRPEGVGRCTRVCIESIMDRMSIPMPPSEGDDGFWLKRGDMAAQTRGDVVYVADKKTLVEKVKEFQDKGITQYVVSAHVKGDLVKFYGVRNTGFFRLFYPTDDGISKFGDERYNGMAQHYRFDKEGLQRKADLLAEAVGVDIYGGDCIVKADGTYCIIDFNDWPSFSRCREEAADAIVTLVDN